MKKGTDLTGKQNSKVGSFAHISSFDKNIPADIPLVTESQMREILSSIREEIASEKKYMDLRIDMSRSYITGMDDEYLFQQGDGTILIDYDILTEMYPYLDMDDMRKKLKEDILDMNRV